MDRKIIFYSKLPTSIKEGFDIALDKDELESTTVMIKGESNLGLIYHAEETDFLIIMGQPAVQELDEDDEVDLNIQEELD